MSWFKFRTSKRNRGSALVECALTVPLLFAFTYGLVSIGMSLWQGQKTTNVAREVAHFTLQQCLRQPSALQDLTNLYQCFDQAAARFSGLDLGVEPTIRPAYRGRIPGFDASTPIVPIRTVFVTCRNWVAVDTNTGMECESGSTDCIRRCGDPGTFPPVPPDPSMIEIRDSSRPNMSPPDSLKMAMWSRFGSLIERRGYILITEIASGFQTQSIWSAQPEDLYDMVVF